jgi:hypothetical protein
MFSAGFFGGIKNAAAFKAQLRLVLLIPRARLMAGRFLQRMERFIFFLLFMEVEVGPRLDVCHGLSINST